MKSEGFTQNAREVLENASKCALKLNAGYVGTEHILVGMLEEQFGVAGRVLNDNGVTSDRIYDMIQELIAPEGGVSLKDKESYSPKAQELLDISFEQAGRFGSDKVGTEHMLLAIHIAQPLYCMRIQTLLIPRLEKQKHSAVEHRLVFSL